MDPAIPGAREEFSLSPCYCYCKTSLLTMKVQHNSDANRWRTNASKCRVVSRTAHSSDCVKPNTVTPCPLWTFWSTWRACTCHGLICFVVYWVLCVSTIQSWSCTCPCVCTVGLVFVGLTGQSVSSLNALYTTRPVAAKKIPVRPSDHDIGLRLQICLQYTKVQSHIRNHRNHRALVWGALMFRISNCSIFPVVNPPNMKTESHKFPPSCVFADLYSQDMSVTKSSVQGFGVVQSFFHLPNHNGWKDR